MTPHAYGVETSFSAEYGSGGRLVVYNAEYDALPGVGHACGHNLIASAALAAFLGAVAALKRSGQPGRVRLLGTPAEEGGGGKLRLISAGAYAGAAASLMVHPGPGYRLAAPVREVAFVRMLANVKVKVYFTGREAHAAMEPWEGVNALDAVCPVVHGRVDAAPADPPAPSASTACSAPPGDRPNVTPANTCVEYYVRSDTRAAARALWEKTKLCFDGAALATGCAVRYEHQNSYADVRPSAGLCRAYVEAMPPGTVSYDSPADFLAGSTDMGNVCYECPGFHGAFGIATEPGQGNHTKAFAKAAGLDESFESALACGRGMAVVGWRVLSDDKFADEIRREWEADMKAAAST